MSKRETFTTEQIETHRATIGEGHAHTLTEFQDCNYADAALAAGVPIGTIKSRLNRARAAITDAIAQDNRDNLIRPISPEQTA